MDVNDLRVLVMVAGLALLLGFMDWSRGSKRRDAFDEAARLPFADDETGSHPRGEQR